MKNGKSHQDTSGPQLIGYARVSTDDQSLDLQIDALNAAGCLTVHQEKISGAAKQRPALDMAIKELRAGDTLVVWRLDRFARSGLQLHTRLKEINDAGASFRSLQENFDFSTTTGKFVLGILGLVAELERNMIADRTKAGMAARMERGIVMGAPVKFTDEAKRAARKMLKERARKVVGGKSVWRPKYTKTEIAQALKISTGTLYNFLNQSTQQ